MANTIMGARPEIQAEIERALEILQKHNYRALVTEDSAGDLKIRFEFGANDQNFHFKKGEWEDAGTVEKKIVDDLDI